MTSSENVCLETFRLDQEASQCGYPICCPGNQPKFLMPSFLPTSLDELDIERDLRKFVSETTVIFQETGMPMFPCILHHFCLPFSPICAAFYCQKKRKERVDEAIEEFNEKNREQGLYLEYNQSYVALMQSNNQRAVVLSTLAPGIELKMNIPQRKKFCEKRHMAFNKPTPAPPDPVSQRPGVIVYQPGHRRHNNGSSHDGGAVLMSPPTYGDAVGHGDCMGDKGGYADGGGVGGDTGGFSGGWAGGGGGGCDTGGFGGGGSGGGDSGGGGGDGGGGGGCDN